MSKQQYEGLKAKLIHSKQIVFDMLEIEAKSKNISLKKYIETLILLKSKEIYLKLEKNDHRK